MSGLANIRLFDARPKRIGRGMKMVTGSCSGSASDAAFDTSQIETFFRRCMGVTVNKAWLTNYTILFGTKWIASTSHLNGQIKLVTVASAGTNNASMSDFGISGQVFTELTSECPIFHFTAWGV